jgi:hypothetical protein
VPRQPDRSNTRLIIAADTPKSLTTRTGTSAAIASSAAVEETVTSPAACSSAAAMDPVPKRTASGSTWPAVTSALHRVG